MINLNYYTDRYFLVDVSHATPFEMRVALGVSVVYSKSGDQVVPVMHLKEMLERLKSAEIKYKLDPQITQAYKSWFIKEKKLLDFKNKHNVTLPVELDNACLTKLYPHQAVGVAWAAKRQRSIICDDTGTGKTAIASTLVNYLFTNGIIQNGLILCPAPLKFQWASELQKFSEVDPVVIDQNSKDVKCKLDKTRLFDKKNDVCKKCDFYNKCLAVRRLPYDLRRLNALQATDTFFVVNYEILRIEKQNFLDRQWGIVIADESGVLKGNNQLTKAFNKLKCNYFVAMSATQIENRPTDLWNVCHLVDPDLLGTKKNFEATHIIREGRWRTIAGYRKEELLVEKLQRVVIRRSRNVIKNELPEVVMQNYVAEMLPQQRLLYDKIYGDACSRKQELKQTGIFEVVTYLREVCDHAALVDVLIDESGKLELLKSLVKTSDTQILIFTQWKRMAEIIKKSLDSCEIASGDLNAQQKDDVIERFKHGDFKNLVSTDCMQYGKNIQNAGVCVNYELPWNPAVVKQRMGRIIRPGSKHSNVFVWNLFTVGTIEDKVRLAITNKLQIYNDLIDVLKAMPSTSSELSNFVFGE